MVEVSQGDCRRSDGATVVKESMRLSRTVVGALFVWLAASPAARADDAGDFTAQAAALYRVAACGGDAAIPERLSKKEIDKHCDRMKRLYTHHRGWWVAKVKKLLATIKPSD